MFNKRITCCYLYPITKYGYPPSAACTLEYLGEMHALGFSSVELEGIRETHLLDVYKQRFAIQSKLKELSLELPYFCAVLPGLSSMDEKTRMHSIELFEKGCETAELLGAKGILDNAPLPPYRFPEDIPIVRHYDEAVLSSACLPDGFEWKKFWEVLIDTFRTLCDIAERHHLTYQLHPAVGVLAGTPDGFLYFHDAVKRDNLRYNFDTANLFALHENCSLAFLRLHEYVDYIHCSDNGGARVEHLAIGKGIIPWESFLSVLKNVDYRGLIGIDIGGAESAVEHLNDAYRHAAEYFESHLFNGQTGI